MVVQDNTGSGDGYTVQVQATQFVNGAHILKASTNAESTLTFDPALIAKDSSSGTVTTLPVENNATAGTPVTADLGASSAVVIAHAESGAGMAIYKLTYGASGQKINWNYPADAYAGTYAGTLFVTMANGPTK